MLANFSIIMPTPNYLPENSVFIKDVGPWDKYATITNAIESVVEELIKWGDLKENGQRLFYVDSEGITDEVIVKDGRFVRFAPFHPKLRDERN